MVLSLNGSDWTLSGWMKHQWLFDRPMESTGLSQPVVPRIPATVPGSVQTDLRRADFIQDWNQDLNFFHLEWTEHREWVYEKRFSADALKGMTRYLLTFEGLDFSGYAFLNGTEILHFDQMHLPYEVDVTDHLLFDEENVLRVVFLQTPEVDGQVGYTSRTTTLKSRFNYGWDWMPRLVNIGIFGDVSLRGVDTAYVTDLYPEASAEGNTGALTVTSAITGYQDTSITVEYTLTYNQAVCYSETQQIELKQGTENTAVLHATLPDICLWNPNGFGEQPLYTLTVSLLNGDRVVDRCEKQIGFKKTEYVLPEGAGAHHYPYSLKINDSWIPIRGVNWVPISPFYGSVTEEDYRYYLERFRAMNVSLIRVWGGALLESETFYRLCDEMGFLVWQEFPQSSSGIDNSPCEDPDFIELLVKVAKVYVTRRRSHTSLVIWCAGNELYDSEYHPKTEASPNIGALKQVVAELDPNRLYLPGSPSGDSAGWSPDKKGTGQCGDTHGPWQYLGPQAHYCQFNEDDSLLHSEIGAPACPRLETLQKYCSTSLWPPSSSNHFWRTRGSWWLCDEQMDSLFGKFDGVQKGITEYVKGFQYTQAEAIRYAASAIRKAGAKKAGTIVWMANEPFPNSANTSILEFDGCPKPVYYKLKNVFAKVFLGLSYGTAALQSDQEATVTLFGCSDQPIVAKNIAVSAYDFSGKLLERYDIADTELGVTTDLATLRLPKAKPMILVRITADIGYDFCEEYVFTVDGETPFGALLDSEKTYIVVERKGPKEFSLTNQGGVTALFVDCIGKDEENRPLTVSGNYRCLLPKETLTVTTEKLCTELTVSAMNSAFYSL